MIQPQVSVIIAAYQQPDFLNAALQSVASQTYANVEIIVVDDCSGAEFTSQYRLPKNARLIVNDARNATAAISRNTALAHASGEFVAFLDQDDLYLPEKLAVQVAALQAHPESPLHFTHYTSVGPDLSPLDQQKRPPRMHRDHLLQFLRRNIVQCPSLVMMRRAAIDKLGGFDVSIRGAADWDMWLRAASLGPILFDPRRLLTYRTHPAQWSKSRLMLYKGCYAVARKAADWIPHLRNDLAWPLRYRQARWLREVAREQLDVSEESHDALPTLRSAAKLFPFDWRIYALMLRAKMRAPATPAAPPRPSRNALN